MPDTLADEGVTFCGEAPDQGRIVIGDQRAGEGYAVLKCGNTEVQISYTVLHGLDIPVSAYGSQIRDMERLRKAVHAITAEASMGRTGDA